MEQISESHHPTTWKLVGQDKHVLVLHSMCSCGDDMHGWTHATYLSPDNQIELRG